MLAVPLLIVAWCFVVGACVGSFLNVVAWRLPNRMSLSWPGSHCPSCKKPILLRDNVPVFGWLWLRGRCRSCGVRISPRYPIVEFITGVAFAALALAELVNAGQNLPIAEPGDGGMQIYSQEFLLRIWLYHSVLAALVDRRGVVRARRSAHSATIRHRGVGGRPATAIDCLAGVVATDRGRRCVTPAGLVDAARVWCRQHNGRCSLRLGAELGLGLAGGPQLWIWRLRLRDARHDTRRRVPGMAGGIHGRLRGGVIVAGLSPGWVDYGTPILVPCRVHSEYCRCTHSLLAAID